MATGLLCNDAIATIVPTCIAIGSANSPNILLLIWKGKVQTYLINYIYTANEINC